MGNAHSELTRRDILAGIGLCLMPTASLADDQVLQDIASLKPGQFTWHPERSPNGPVAIIVSLPRQRVHLYRNGIRIAVSTCSSGKAGHQTPTGVFVILQKDRDHKSSTYDDAPMPNMNRLTWSGIALHAGNLPGYPASHGCVRLPFDFSAKLFTLTHVGTPVILAGAPNDPPELVDPGLILGGYAAGQFSQIVAEKDGRKHPSDWAEAEKQPVTSVIASSSDRKIVLISNAVVVAEAPLTIEGAGSLGNHVFSLQGLDENAGLQWIDVTGSAARSGAQFRSPASILGNLTTTKDFAALLQSSLHPGAILVLTDAPLHPDNRTGEDFVIMS